MNYLEKMKELIKDEDRFNAVLYSLDLLEQNKLDLVTLYQDVLSVVLREIDCNLSKEECIWKEHVKSAIVRSVLEACFPYVIKESQKVTQKNKTVLIVCPSEEYHEIGAKMAYDFFLLHGYNAVFIGANTPTEEILSAVKYSNPDYLAISVTDKYNLIKARQIVNHVKKAKEEVKIIIGGLAFTDQQTRDQIEYDYHLTSFASFAKVGD